MEPSVRASVYMVGGEGSGVPDVDDFESFYEATYAVLVAQLFVMTGHLDEAEEVVQEALARAAARWSKIATYDQPAAWVRRVALHLVAQDRRRARRWMQLVHLMPAPPPLPDITPDGLALVEALRRLPMAQRQAIVLHDGLGMPLAEVARELDVPAGTVKSRVSRARAALARELSDEHAEVHER